MTRRGEAVDSPEHIGPGGVREAVGEEEQVEGVGAENIRGGGPVDQVAGYTSGRDRLSQPGIELFDT